MRNAGVYNHYMIAQMYEESGCVKNQVVADIDICDSSGLITWSTDTAINGFMVIVATAATPRQVT